MAEHGDAIELVVSDIRMPGGDGVEFARWVRTTWPDVRVLLISGYGLQERLDDEGIDFLPKPFGMRDFKQRVSALLAE